MGIWYRRHQIIPEVENLCPSMSVACAEAFAEFLQYLLCAGVPDRIQDTLTSEALASRPFFS